MAKGGGSINLTINVVGVKELQMKLMRLHRAMSDYREPLARIEKYINQKTAQGFRYGGAEKQWKPLHPTTIAKKGSSEILIDTGRLRADASSPSSRVQAGSILTLTVNVEYGAYHQFGIGVPQRKFFTVLPQEERQMALFVRAYIQKFVAGR